MAWERSIAPGTRSSGATWRSKSCRKEFAHDRRRLDRFEREAKLLASLNHPNIAAIYGLEESAGTQFIVMELVEGESLAERLRRGAMDAEEALGLARQVAEGLDAAHEKGIIHRDIKPGNIQVTPDDHVKVLDFGLGKELVTDAAGPIQSNSPTLSRGATQEGVILGTAPYMSPEQARGKPVDKRADIWAFGCVLFEMLSGRAAFLGEDVSDTLAAVIRGNVDWSALPAGVAPKLRDLLRRCLEKDPKKRYRDIGDVLVDVDETLRSPHEVGPLDDTSRASASRPRILLAIVALLLTGAFIGIATWVSVSDPPRLPVTRFAVALPSGDSLSFRHNKFALSPDSSHLVYAATDRLYVRPMDQAQATAIQERKAVAIRFFPPDGQSVGFWVSGELKKVPLGGGPAQRLCSTTTPHGVS